MEVETDYSGEEVVYTYDETRHEHRWEDTHYWVNLTFDGGEFGVMQGGALLQQCAICGVLRVKVDNG